MQQALLLTGLCLVSIANVCGQPAVLTWHNDLARSGQMPAETVLQPANVNSTSFGMLFTLTVDGNVDAEPLYVPAVNFSGTLHNVLIVATENDSVFAFDADTGAQLWQATTLPAGETTSEPVYGCGQVYPQIGITSTPVIDPTAGPNGVVYVVAMSKDSSGDYIQRLHALDLVTKAELFGGPVAIQASYPGTGDNSTNNYVIFEPKAYKERAALLLLNGTIYTSWASHCDIQPYTGWVIGYNELSLQQVSVINLTPNGAEGAIWGSGAGPAADANGYIYLLMANGSFDSTLNMQGFPDEGDYGNAFMKLSTAGGVLSVTDYFAMDNDVNEDDNDTDLGSGGAMLLPPLQDSQDTTHYLAVGAGKDTHMYVVDTGNMGKFNPSVNTQIYQDLPGALPGGIWSAPAWFNGSVYYGSVGNHIQAFPFANGSFSANPVATGTSFTYPGATPSVSANGTSNGIVWALENTSPAVLHAYRADTLSTELYNTNQAAGGRDQFGSGNKFVTPMIANGKVYAGEAGTVGVFGLLNCSYSIDQHQIYVPADGVTGSVNLTTSSGCLWSTYSDASFVTVNGAGAGSGSGPISYTMSANTTGAMRTGHLTIAGQTVTLSQPVPLLFVPVTPCRIADTRNAAGPFGGPAINAGTLRSFTIPNSSCGIPSTAAAYSLNVTVVPQTKLGYLTVWPTGQSEPTVSTLNSLDGRIKANAAIIPAGAGGAINVYATNTTNVVLDIDGYFTTVANDASGLAFYPVTPCRIADTRTTNGTFGGPSLSAGSTRVFPIQSSSCSIPASAQAYSLNFTVVPTSTLGYLTTWPDGQTQPLVSTLNDLTGTIVANAAIVPAGNNGAIDVYVTNSTNLVIDTDGYFAPPGAGGLSLYDATPCRALDTRIPAGSLPFLGQKNVNVEGSVCSPPSAVQAYVLNATVVPAVDLGYLTLWAQGQTQPVVSTLNALDGAITSNMAIVPTTNGEISSYATNETQLILDFFGYFAP